MSISSYTYTQLKEAGWYEERRIDISKHIKFLEEHGFEVFDAAKKFLMEFGDLDIFHKSSNINGIMFNATSCIRTKIFDIYDDDDPPSAYSLDCEEFNALGEKALLIGDLSHGEMWLYITESGKFFTDVFFCGNNAFELFEGALMNDNSIGCTWDEYFKRQGLLTISERQHQITSLIKKQGWSEWGRWKKRDAKDKLKILKEKGYEVSDRLKEFIEIYGDFNLKAISSDEYQGMKATTDLSTNILDVINDTLSGKYSLEKYIEGQSIVVGKFSNGLHLFYNECGALFTEEGYLGYDFNYAIYKWFYGIETMKWDDYYRYDGVIPPKDFLLGD